MAQQFYVKINNVEHGPMTGEKIKEMAQSGQISPTDEVRLANYKTWVQAGNFKGLQFANEPAPEGSFDLPVSIPSPPAYPAITTFIGLYYFLGCLIVSLALVVFLVSIAMSIREENLLIVGGGVLAAIVYLFIAAFCFFSAQLLNLALDSARNLHRLTHSNLLIMRQSIVNKK